MMFSKMFLSVFFLSAVSFESCEDMELLSELWEEITTQPGDPEDLSTLCEEVTALDQGQQGVCIPEEESGQFARHAVYKIVSKRSGKSLDIAGQSIENGANLGQWDYWGGSNQKWVIEEKEDGSFLIVNLYSGKCLDVSGGSNENGANVLQWDCWGGDNQKWNIAFVENETFTIRNKNSDKCLDLQDGNPNNGTNVFQWDCWDSDNQKWNIVPVQLEDADNTIYQKGAFVKADNLAERMPLSTLGRFIVDREGKRIKLVSANWYGASDVYHVVGGLDHTTPVEIAKLIKQMGFNSVRLPFSNEMLLAQNVPQNALSSNPDLQGLTALEIFDRVVKAITEQGLMVVLNNHTSTGKWCCGFDDNALWFAPATSTEDWMLDWEMLIERYKNNPLVVGADLRNELRAGTTGTPNWGEKNDYDWHRAATILGNRLHRINEHLLIIVEGLDYAGDLRGVKEQPVQLEVDHKLVYSPHNYHFFRGESGPYSILPYEYMKADLDSAWGFILEEGNEYTAPIWLSEFGIGRNDEGQGGRWFAHIVRYLKENDIDWAWWPLNVGNKPGTQEEESWGLVSDDWTEALNDWRTTTLTHIQKATLGPGLEGISRN